MLSMIIRLHTVRVEAILHQICGKFVGMSKCQMCNRRLICEDICNLQKVADLTAKWLEMEVTLHSDFKGRFWRHHVEPKIQGIVGLKKGVFGCMLWQKGWFQPWHWVFHTNYIPKPCSALCKAQRSMRITPQIVPCEKTSKVRGNFVKFRGFDSMESLRVHFVAAPPCVKGRWHLKM